MRSKGSAHEDELGVTLFDRVKRPIQLTLVGTTLAELATPLLKGIDSLEKDVSRKEEQGPVTIASQQKLSLKYC